MKVYDIQQVMSLKLDAAIVFASTSSALNDQTVYCEEHYYRYAFATDQQVRSSLQS